MPPVARAPTRMSVRLKDDRGESGRLQSQCGRHAGQPAAHNRDVDRCLNVSSEHLFRVSHLTELVEGWTLRQTDARRRLLASSHVVT